jgi:uncharacterized membrane protein
MRDPGKKWRIIGGLAAVVAMIGILAVVWGWF